MNSMTETQAFTPIELRDDERQRCEVWTDADVSRWESEERDPTPNGRGV